MGWLIDPAEQTVFVWRSHQEMMLFDQPKEMLSVPAFASALELSVRELFAWLMA